jgi:hypothetical protein
VVPGVKILLLCVAQATGVALKGKKQVASVETRRSTSLQWCRRLWGGIVILLTIVGAGLAPALLSVFASFSLRAGARPAPTVAVMYRRGMPRLYSGADKSPEINHLKISMKYLTFFKINKDS